MIPSKFTPEFEEWLNIKYNKSINLHYSVLYFQKRCSLNINEDLFNKIYQEYAAEMRQRKINNLLYEYAMEELCSGIKFKEEFKGKN